MKETTKKIYEELFERYPVLEGIKTNVLNIFEIVSNNTGKSCLSIFPFIKRASSLDETLLYLTIIKFYCAKRHQFCQLKRHSKTKI